MMISEFILLGTTCIATLVASAFAMDRSMHREQVRRLQHQLRLYRDANLGHLVPDVEGLWPDLDEKHRLRARVRELESGERGEGES